jgi:hypothetical protein
MTIRREMQVFRRNKMLASNPNDRTETWDRHPRPGEQNTSVMGAIVYNEINHKSSELSKHVDGTFGTNV